jgi:hypothetical protein
MARGASPSSSAAPLAERGPDPRAVNPALILICDTELTTPIDSAPLDEDVSLVVTDGRGGDPYRLPYPCRRTAAGWVSSNKGSLQTVVPTKWKPHRGERKWKRD